MKKAPLFIVAAVAVIFLATAFIVSYEKFSFIKSEVMTQEISENKVEIFVPALDVEGKGVIGRFEVEAIPGDGKTLTNIDNLLFFVDTQFSIQIAKAVAANVTGVDISKYNIIYEIQDFEQTNVSRVVEGPSAGAALTVATIAALQNKDIDSEVMITGTIEPDGKIGSVGGVKSKIEAARLAGAKVLLVPLGQGLKPSFKVERACEQVNSFKVCRTEYVRQPTIANTEFGLIVREVATVSEALNYFLQNN